MKILLSGVQTTNKGAELMLYAILQEIERRHPYAIVYIPRDRIKQGLDYVKTKLNFKYIPCERIERVLRLKAIFRRLHLPFNLLPHLIALGRVDYYLDGSGFKFSDQFSFSEHYAEILSKELDALKKKGCKIIYLPQAFGPFENSNSKKILKGINHSTSLLFTRESVSFDYVKKSQLVDMEKVRLYTDFTSLVEGVLPGQFEYLRNGVCVIPNMQMINKGAISKERYLELLKSIIKVCKETGRTVYLLNHEGKEDEKLCFYLKTNMGDEIDVVTGLNALEVKGLISSAYLVVSSRFHGIVSALNSGVPSLATSWSHKYKELFKDYKQEDCILTLDDLGNSLNMVRTFLMGDNNRKIRNQLSTVIPYIKEENQVMWNEIWNK